MSEHEIKEGILVKALKEGILDMDAQIMIDDGEYRELVRKAKALDILIYTIRTTGHVDEDTVRAVTGTLDAKVNEDLQKYKDWWHDEADKTRALEKQVQALKNRIAELEATEPDKEKAE